MDQTTQVDLAMKSWGCVPSRPIWTKALPIPQYHVIWTRIGFQLEQQKLFRGYPLLVAHVSELADEGDFLRHLQLRACRCC